MSGPGEITSSRERNRHPRRPLRMLLAAMVAAAALGGSAFLPGCGGEEGAEEVPDTPTQASTRVAPSTSGTAAGAVPPSLIAAESAAEDIMDLALSGDRTGVVERAKDLASGAQGDVAAAALAAGVPAATVTEFKARAARVARLAPEAPLVEVAIAANRAFALVPGLLAPFDNPVPPDVITLDYLDFEAKLEATAGDRAKAVDAASRLERAWSAIRAQVSERSASAASRYDRHVSALKKLTAAGDLRAATAEAQNGLDLVDVVEEAFTG